MPLLDVDVSRMIEDVKTGGQPSAPSLRLAGASSGSPAVRKLVEPHRKALEANIGLAFFGL
jgi:hypothetical protein